MTKGNMQVRVVSLAIVVAVIFVVLAARLWQLQVLTGNDYTLSARHTQTREVKDPAQRGVIYDRDGEVLANNVPGLNVTVVPDEISREKVQELAEILGADKEAVLESYDAAFELGNEYGPMLVKENANRDDVTYISERTEEFSGVAVNDDYVRNYPKGDVAAHILGYTGAITQEELKLDTFKGLSNDSVVGKSGVELYYEELLRGEAGKKVYNVDALRHYPPEGIHVVDFLTGFAAQKLLVIELDPALTDYRVVGEAFVSIQFELFLRDCTGVAEDVGGHIPLRIVANVVVVHGDARELLGALADVGDVVAVGVLFDQHRAVLVPQLEGRVVALEYRLGVGPEDLGELLDLLPGYFVGNDRHVEAGDVVREDLAVAVVDDAALGGVLDLAGLGMPGRERVVIAREDLQLPQPGRQDYEDHRDHDRQRDHTHLHVALGHGRRIPALLGGPRLLLLAHRKPDHRLPFPLVAAGPVTLSAWTIRRRE